ncbi:MAG TPA: hypothetical protein VMU60_09640 [Syntrophobacteria bacterium]|nr:hypothetical protein [Syntrophobacteria bacterium]
MYRLVKLSLCCLLLGGCTHHVTKEPATDRQPMTYRARYGLLLSQVERPEKASQWYGPAKIETLSSKSDYQYVFEDELVRVRWAFRSNQMALLLENKGEHSIQIPWDGAAFVDESSRSHRVMHASVKFADRDKPQPPSVVAPKASLEDIVAPTDYVRWVEGTGSTAGRWEGESLLPDFDLHSSSLKGEYATFADFETAAKSKVGKTFQILLPLRVEDVVNNYIFTFQIKSADAFEEAGQPVMGRQGPKGGARN